MRSLHAPAGPFLGCPLRALVAAGHAAEDRREERERDNASALALSHALYSPKALDAWVRARRQEDAPDEPPEDGVMAALAHFNDDPYFGRAVPPGAEPDARE